MNKTRILWAVIAFLCFWACNDDVVSEHGIGNLDDQGTYLDVVIESGTSSRVMYEGYDTKFVEGDRIGVYGETFQNVPFVINGELRRAYSEAPVTMEKGTEYYAYYPYNEELTDVTAMPVKISKSQTQSDANFSHISEYDYLVVAPATIVKTTVASFQHVGAWIDLLVYNREASPMTITGAKIKSQKGGFIESGTVDITAAKDGEEYLKVTPATYTDEINVNISGDWAKDIPTGKSAVIRVAILPSDMSNDTLSVEIQTSAGQITQSFKGRDFKRGHAYQLSYNDKKIYLTGNLWLPEGASVSRFNFRTADLYDEKSNFCWQRSKQSENLIVFWEPGFGDDPSKCTKRVGNVSMKVDVDNLLEKMEAYYARYRDELKFVIPGYSRTDTHKMIIFLFYTDVWIAYGGGVDNYIGTFWIGPSACNPVGQTVAHELGHSFQYQVAADVKTDPDLLYHSRGCGFGHNIGQGNGFWEQCANYMAWQNLEYFKTWGCEIPVHQANAHKGFTHEWVRYQYFYLMSLWEELHGRDILARVWRFSNRGEDAIQAYQRITNTSQDKFNDEIWLSAAKEQTWSFTYDEINQYMRNMLDKLSKADRDKYYTNKTWLIHNSADDYYRCYPDTYTKDQGTNVNYALSPQSYGYNAVHLKVPQAGTEITIDFEGLSSYPETEIADYNYSSTLGWRWGIVACTGDGGWTPVYSEMQSSDSGSLTFTVPEDTKRLVFLVTGAPTSHRQKDWDEDVSDDYHFPYRFKVTGTSVNTSYVKVNKEEVEL